MSDYLLRDMLAPIRDWRRRVAIADGDNLGGDVLSDRRTQGHAPASGADLDDINEARKPSQEHCR